MDTILTHDIALAARLLRDGELVAFPTETVYGLGGNGLDPSASAAIYAAKGRPSDNPLILHVAELGKALELTTAAPGSVEYERFIKLADAFWPGPLTMIVPASAAIPREVTAGLDTVAIRMPSHPVARELLLECGLPIAAPSANLSGTPSPTKAEHVMRDFDGRIAAVLDGGDCSVGVESTIVSLTGEQASLLRPGGIGPDDIERALGESITIDKAVTRGLAAGEVARAPGMKYRHYAPKTPLKAIVGAGADSAKRISAELSAGDCVLCFDEFREYFGSLGAKCLCYGPENDPDQQARELFDALRRIDALGSPRAFAQMKHGVGASGTSMAVENRLSKAAGFDVERV